jgi:glycosyltransferase involved in cell wall biosynthesis
LLQNYSGEHYYCQYQKLPIFEPMNVVWLTSWFPNRTDTTTGDFIERHAYAVAPFVQHLSIVLVVKDENMQPGSFEIITKTTQNITTYIAYYGKGTWGTWLEKLYSYKTYQQLQLQIFNTIKNTVGLPQLLHVHVAMKAGLFAKKIKEIYQIPYLITEHWTGYFPYSIPNLQSQGFLFKRATKMVFKHAQKVLPVTNHLGNTIHQTVYPIEFTAIPNVVDTNNFTYLPLNKNLFTFIHLSYLNHQKNVVGMIEACSILKTKGILFNLVLIGNENNQLTDLAASLGLLNEIVFIKKAIPYQQVAQALQQSNALLMFSRYENLPCVIEEALCCGLPVITTRVGGIDEVINDTNGIFVPSEDVPALAAAMHQMMDTYSKYNNAAIAAAAQAKFNYNTIGKAIYEQYQQVIGL